jgi:hemolysin-activating ACP:hemolysin acyltransferase
MRSLRPDEWRSGEILWLVDAVGEADAVQHLLRELEKTTFNGGEVKVRRWGPDFRPTVEVLRTPRPT